MRRIVALLLAVLMTLTMTTLSWAEGESAVGATGPTSGTCGAESNEGGRGSVKWEVTPNGGKVASEDKDGNTVLLPAYTLTISGKGDIMDKVGQDTAGNWNTKDGGNYAKQITSVIIGEGITGTGNNLTAGMNMFEISFPASLTSCGNIKERVANITVAEGNTAFKVQGNALLTADGETFIKFFSKNQLESYSIPDGVKTLRTHSFSFSSVTHITIPDSVTSIERYSFQNAMLEELVIPDSVTTIGSDAVAYECPELKRLVIGDGITTLVSGHFRSNPKLEEVVFGSGIKKIASAAFNKCTALKTIRFSKDCKIEYFSGFENCQSLESIEVPGSVKLLETNTFAGATNLREVILNEGLQTIKYWVFKGTAVDSITIPSTVETVYGQEHGFLKVTLSKNFLVLPVAGVGKTGEGIGMKDPADGFSRFGWFDKDGEWLMSGGGTTRKELTKQTTAYAVYEADCTFDLNGGQGTVTAIKSYIAPGLDDGQSMSGSTTGTIAKKSETAKNKIPATIPTRDGYAFLGWNTEADGSGDSYNSGDYLKTTNQPLTKLYAQWGKKADDATVYTVSCDTSLVYTGTSQTPSVTVKMMPKDSGSPTPLTAGTFRVEADTDFNAGMHTGTVYLVDNDTTWIDFNYEIKKAPCALTVTGETNVKGGGTVSLHVTGTSVTKTGDGDLKGSFEDGVYTATAPDSTKNYTVTFTDAGDANHEGGTKTVTVAVTARKDAYLDVAEATRTMKVGATGSVTYTYNGDGEVTAFSSDESVAAVTVDAATKTITVKAGKKGSADIFVAAKATENYRSKADVLVLTVTDAAVIKSDAETKEIDAGAAKELIINVPDINGKPAKVVFNQAAADYLRGRGEDLTLKLAVIPVPASLKNSDQFKNKSCIMVEITLTNDAGANVFTSSVAGAKADVEFFGGTAMENVTAYFVQSAELTAQPVTYTAATGMIALHLEHFSKYLVAGDTPSTPAAPSSGGRRHYTGTPGAEITGGADQTKRAGDIIKVTAKSDGAKVSAVYVDGAMVDGKYYIVSGNAVKLQGTYTATLSQGTHTLRVVYTNGAAVTTTFVLKGTTSPHTGDPGVGIYLASAVLSIAGSAYVFRKKKNDD